MECAPPNRPNAVFPSCDRSYMRIAPRAFVLPQGGIVLRAESLLYVSASLASAYCAYTSSARTSRTRSPCFVLLLFKGCP